MSQSLLGQCNCVNVYSLKFFFCASYFPRRTQEYYVVLHYKKKSKFLKSYPKYSFIRSNEQLPKINSFTNSFIRTLITFVVKESYWLHCEHTSSIQWGKSSLHKIFSINDEGLPSTLYNHYSLLHKVSKSKITLFAFLCQPILYTYLIFYSIKLHNCLLELSTTSGYLVMLGFICWRLPLNCMIKVLVDAENLEE
jgi:hypothetical protein